MALKLRTEKTDAWVTYSRGDGEARFLVRSLTPSEVNKLIQRNTAKEFERGQRFERFDVLGFKHDKIDAVIRDWEGVEDSKGTPLTCNRANKVLVFEYNSEVVDWVLEQVDEMADLAAEEQAEEKKNSSPGRSSKRAG